MKSKTLIRLTVEAYPSDHVYGCIQRDCFKGADSDALTDVLFKKYNIFTVIKNVAEVSGVRVTPHLYNSPDDLDRLVAALQELAA